MHVGCQVRVANGYNELAKVTALKTFQNEPGGFKLGFHFDPRKQIGKQIGNK